MPPTQATTSPVPTSLHTSVSGCGSTPPNKWHTLATTFITLFAVLLALSTIALYRLHHRRERTATTTPTTSQTKKQEQDQDQTRVPNPHPFGSDPWRAHELAQVPAASGAALRIAGLEAQVVLLEERAGVLEGLAGLLERRNGDLRRENARLRLESGSGSGSGSGPRCMSSGGSVVESAAAAELSAVVTLDPDVVRRVYEEVHRPVRKPSLETGTATEDAGRH
ncbi:hypothetical protein VSDG_03518 [Cytospora chrysosperma]|uniref:Uncharacterized protein n=1 Tax=Cytospora chrysosperma TaxID=252740 RepID=A0A423W9P3_CYTCH|nr:hypothetical protein VSDG_03518 [Valsa sordida]